MKQYDFLIIGGGQAGVPLAHALAKAGKSVALVERKRLGGSCVNFGCTPTKAAIASARVAHLVRRAKEFGIRLKDVTVHFPTVLERARDVAEASRDSLEKGFRSQGAPELIRGHARLAGRAADFLQVAIEGVQETDEEDGTDDSEVTARQVVINTGARTRVPPVKGIEQVSYLHAGNWLDHEILPGRLAVLGGGYIGVEMAQFYRRMGSAVVVIDGGTQVLHSEDGDVAKAVREALEADGVDFRFRSRVIAAERSSSGVTLQIESAGRLDPLSVTDLFVAAGRQPNTDDLGLETVGVRLRADGTIDADDRLATGAPGVWCAGDVRGGPMFTHTSWDDFRVLESQFLGDGSRTTHRIVPYAVFTDPELGRVGMTENQAKSSGKSIKTSRFEMSRNGKASEIGETRGFIKTIVEADTDRLLGAAVFANEGAELVHSFVTLMNAGAPASVIRDAVFIHPTLSEAVQSAVRALGK